MTRSLLHARRRRGRLAAVAAVLALTASACTSTDLGDVAATVDGEEITVDDLDDLVEQIEAAGGGDGSDPFTQALAAEVQNVALVAFLDDRGIEATPAEVDERLELAAQQQGLELDDFVAQQVDNGITEEELREQVGFQVRIDKFQDDVLDQVDVPQEEVRALFEERQASLAQATVSHVLVETEEEAQAALDRLDGGEDFAAVAEDVSQDPGSAAQGGSLGEAPLTTYVPEFAEAAAAAEIGEVVGPVETQFGFHLIRVDERSEPTFEDVEADLRAELAGEQLQTVLFEQVKQGLAQVDIDVNSRFGRWDPDEGQIGGVVPAGPLEGDDGDTQEGDAQDAPAEDGGE